MEMINRLLMKAQQTNPALKERCTGRTTVLALQLIANCIDKPNTWFTIEDHHVSRLSNLYLQQMVGDYVAKLGLKFFEFDKQFSNHLRVRCNLFEVKTTPTMPAPLMTNLWSNYR